MSQDTQEQSKTKTKKIYNLETGKLEEVEVAVDRFKDYKVNEKGEVEHKNKRKGSVLWAILRTSFFAIIFLAISVAGSQVYLADKYEASVKVATDKDKIAVNPSGTNLDFGDLPQDSSAIRYISLVADDIMNVDTYVYVFKFGAIAELIKINPNNFIIKDGEKKQIEASLYMPLSAPVNKEYKGRVWVFKIPKIW